MEIKRMRHSTAMALLSFALAAAVGGQTPAGQTPGSPIPRTLDGKPDLNGIWNHPYVPDMAATTKNGVMSQEGPGALPYTPKAAADFKNYDPHLDGDYTGSCLPFGYLRSFNAPYPIQILQTPQYIGFLFEQNTWFHTVAMNRKHPEHLEPSWFGDSIGTWDGDTLVIDTIGFNGLTRLDTLGHQHSDAMHVVQRIQRLDAQRLRMEITIDDPKVYAEPWKNTRIFALMKPGSELIEYSCEENNRDFTQGHIKRPEQK
jgi:hypothetical protein